MKMKRAYHYLCITVALLLLSGMAVEALSHPSPEDAMPYHNRVRRAVATIPIRIGPWVGEDAELPRAAEQLLKPNAQLSRVYQNDETGRRVTFTIIQCRDAGDMQGHYPPNCYPGQGWIEQETRPVTWQVGDTELPGMEYEFQQLIGGRVAVVHISNILILPDGQVTRKMRVVRSAAANYRAKHYGAAQIQFLFGGGTASALERQQITEQFLQTIAPVIQEIRSGVSS
jgi:hypothetical protein